MPTSMIAAFLLLGAPAGSPQCHAFSASCCKVCGKGKACGDSCIARDRRCSKGPGCACDAGS